MTTINYRGKRIRLLGLELAPVCTSGYDVIRKSPAGDQHLQVKGRVMFCEKLKGRLGSINTAHEFDGVLLVLLDKDLNATKIFEAPRAKVLEAIRRPGSKARNERGALSIPTFCKPTFSRQVWPATWYLLGRLCAHGRGECRGRARFRPPRRCSPAR